MRLSSDAESTASWPSEFAATYVASLDDAGALTTSLDIHNAGSEPMTFTTALHTYFRCADALTARVEGLRGREYLDSLDGRVRKTENGARSEATRRDDSPFSYDRPRTRARRFERTTSIDVS